MPQTHAVPGTTRRAAFAAAAFALAGPASAQSGFHSQFGGHGGPTPGIAEVWREFTESCEALLTDPEGFVTAHPATSPDGMELINRSTDNQVVVLTFTTPAGVWRQMELIGVPGELHVVCQAASEPDVESILDPGAYAESSDRSEAELRALLAGQDGHVVVGGRMPLAEDLSGMPGVSDLPVEIYTYIFGIRWEFAGAQRFVYANVNGPAMHLTGHYVIRAEDFQAARETAEGTRTADVAAAAETPVAGPEGTMRSVAELCLRNYRTPADAAPAIRALGLDLVPGMDAGSWEFSGSGVSGLLTADQELYCSIQSREIPLDQAQAIGSDLANALFPGAVQVGAPEGGKGPCDGLSIFAPRQLIWLRYAQAGNSGECINDGTSAIIIN